MILKKFTLLLLLGFTCFKGLAQTPCSTLGQTPGSAFPVCGTDTFHQSTVPPCGGTAIPTPGCSGLFDLNPFWYRFKCFSSGTLGFVITPNNQADDYDWQIFDITGRNPNDLYSDVSMFVACNWTGEPGNTGASSAGTKLTTCGSTSGPPFENAFSVMPQLIEGHEYILMISHFSGSDQSGYDLSFGAANGGTASIIDPTEPGLSSARAICDGLKMTVKLSKKMKCSSLNANGSDFTVTPAFAPIVAAEGVNCNNGFDMDSVVLTLASPVPPGTYTITVKNDINGINLLDNCNRTIPLGQNLSVTVFPQIPTPMDSLINVGCAPAELRLVFSKPMQCNSVAADGSDFIVTGSQPVTVTSASCLIIPGTGNSGQSNIITVALAAPLSTQGNFTITLKKGSDGNTVMNECSMETPVGSFINFTTVDTVSADFAYNIHLGCKTDVIDYSHDGRNGVNFWKWTFDNGITSNKKDTSISYTVFNNKTATLVVSNGVCRDSVTNNAILLDNFLDAQFENTAVVCPGDPAVFKDKSFNRVVAWNWDFGNVTPSNLQEPPPQFYNVGNNNSIRDVPVKLIVTNDIGCSDTATGSIRVVGNCFIAVPTAFTPNGDGLNDYLFPTNAYKAKDLYFAVYNRNGNKIFETRDWTNKWDGTYKGNPQDPGTYVWFLYYTHIETGQRMEQKGATVLIR
ncbi:MAG: gliding motility-associated C-terminal domain-containing protein [Chitinophagaceae bacterium]|nr:gliding motility-associated C-terminal domain-containing protein [Chitinophagaceae bacterium]